MILKIKIVPISDRKYAPYPLKKSVPYFLAKTEAYRTVPTYPIVPYRTATLAHRYIKWELRLSEAIYHKIHDKILRLLKKKNELATFYSFDEIRKKLREPQVW